MAPSQCESFSSGSSAGFPHLFHWVAQLLRSPYLAAPLPPRWDSSGVFCAVSGEGCFKGEQDFVTILAVSPQEYIGFLCEPGSWMVSW